MLWRPLCLARAWSAAGLLGCTLLGTATLARAGSDGPSPVPAPPASETVSVLQASKAGDLRVEVRGAGQDHVRIELQNVSAKRLNVLLPPGLVASSASGQPGGRGGGGFQSMGLGSVSNRPGSFGEFRLADGGQPSGFRSVGVEEARRPGGVVVPVGQTVGLDVASVCLNYGVATPTAHDRFELVDVDDYTTDPRARKALRSLATFGTSQGVAQAVMWKVCNDLPFEVMLQNAGKVMNAREVALAARFVEALDGSASDDLVDPSQFLGGRLFVRVTGEGALSAEAGRLSRELEGLKLLGLRVEPADAEARAAAPALLLNVVLSAGQAGETRGRLLVSQADLSGQWAPLGKTTFTDGSAPAVLDGPTLARAVDRAVSSAFVSTKVARRGNGTTTFKVDNRLPFTVARLAVRAGDSSGAPIVELDGLGVAPGRSSLVTVEAPTARVEHVGLNGL